METISTELERMEELERKNRTRLVSYYARGSRRVASRHWYLLPLIRKARERLDRQPKQEDLNKC